MQVHSGAIAAEGLPKNASNSKIRLKPIRPIPTDRISPQNQLSILRNYAVASDNRMRAATVNEVSQLCSMAASTVAMANPFYSSIGLLQRLDVGTYSPSEQVTEFANCYDRDPERAAHSLAPAFRDAWFGKLLLPKLADGPLDEETVLFYLMTESEAGPDYKKALGVLLELMAAAGLIICHEGKVSLLPGPVVLKKNSKLAQICVTIRIDTKDLSGWAPDQIGALLEGLAELMSKQK